MPQYLKYRRALPCFKVVDNYFTPDEVDKIVDLEELQKFSKGTFGPEGQQQSDEEARNSDISWIYPDAQSQWVFDKFGILLGHVNHDVFMYDIDGFDYFQYTRYKKKQHYDWHFDRFMEYSTWERKISAIIMLSDPEEYKGGELDIVAGGNPEKPTTIKPSKGSVVFFASWMVHRVRPVTSGTRKTLVTWVMGKTTC